jgi:hypothetical protein
MTRNITEAIIRDETNSIRFEDFCREVCERHDGIRMIPTSKSYDQGRDAKSLDPRHGAFVCATLQKKDLEGKIDADTRHLQSTSSPSRVTYCTSVPLSEDAIDDFERLIRKNTPQATVRVLSAPQVADLAAEFPEIITKYYLAELRQIETMFLRLEDGLRRTDDDALRLALLALGTDDSRQLREDIAQTAILQALRRSQTPLSVERIRQRNPTLTAARYYC